MPCPITNVLLKISLGRRIYKIRLPKMRILGKPWVILINNAGTQRNGLRTSGMKSCRQYKSPDKFSGRNLYLKDQSHSSFNETHIVILVGKHPLPIEVNWSSRVSPTARNLILKRKIQFFFVWQIHPPLFWKPCREHAHRSRSRSQSQEARCHCGRQSSSPHLHRSWSRRGHYSWLCTRLRHCIMLKLRQKKHLQLMYLHFQH